MIQFKANRSTVPSKLASAIAHNIGYSDIEISCLGAEAVNATIKGLVIAKKYTQNEDFRLRFDFATLEALDNDDKPYNFIKCIVLKDYSEEKTYAQEKRRKTKERINKRYY